MKTKYRNVAFLAELLINILVFSISCAVLVGLFGKAWQVARDTREKSFAGAEAQALVETVKAHGAEGMTHARPQADGTLACYYDKAWQPLPAGEDGAAYVIRVQVAPEDTGAGTLTRIVAVASAGEDGGEIYRLETAAYRPAGGAP